MMSQATTSPVQSSNYNSNMGESNSSLPRQPKVSYFLSLEGDEVETPAMERTHNNSSELAQSTEEELHLSAADVDRSQEQDRFNLSRDDSDIGGEYFLRGLAVTGSPAPAAAAAAALSSSPAYSASPSSVWEGSAALMGTDTHFAAYLRTARSPPRVMSSHSLLLGEDILVTTHSSSGHQQQQHGSPLEEQQQQCPFIIEEELFTSSYLNTPFLPQFRGEGDFGSVSTNSSPLAEAEEDNVMFTPNHLILSPGTQVTTPPSALFPPSLSPPLLINDDLRSNHGIRFNGGDGSGVEYSQHQLKQQQHEQYRQQDGSQASPFSKPLRKRPPRAPSNLTLRSFQPLGIPPASHTSNNSNINAGINRSIIAFNNRSNNGFDHHIRVQSNGDESLLSALTDSDCEGTGFYGMVGGGGRPVARVVSSSTSCGAIAVPRQRHSSSSSLPNLAWTSDGVVAQQQQQERKDVPGMNIDIPSSLQQPVLGDEDEDEDGHSTGHVDDSNDDERNSGKQCRDDRRVAAEVSSLQDFQSPVIQQRKDKGCAEDDICEKDLLNDHQPDEDKLGSLREFEAEAEIALLAAIEEMRNKSTGDGVRKNAHLKPYNSPEEDSERSSNTVRSSETTLDENETKAAENQTSAVTQWLALQNADEDVVASLVLREEELKNYFQLGAVDMLVNNAQILLSATKNGRTSCNATTMSSQISRSDTRKKYDATLTQEEDAADKGDNAMEDAEARRKEAAPLIDTAAHMPQLLKAHFDRYMRQIKEDWVVFDWCSHLQKGKVESYITNLLTFIIIPSLGLASLLFVLDNPKIGEGPTSRDQTEAIENEMASLSWRVIFFGVRHPLVWSLARGAEYFFIKFFCHEKSGFFILVGPEAGVSFVQSRGWPCVLFFYGVFSLGLLYGKSDFAKHWLYWQHMFEIFRKTNPAGDITTRDLYFRSLTACIAVGVLVTLKRVQLGFHLGRRIFARHGDDLEVLMKKLIILSEVASLSMLPHMPSRRLELEELSDEASRERIDEPLDKGIITNEESSTLEIFNLLEEWNEPFKFKPCKRRVASLKEIVEFRHTIFLMQTEFPFSRPFGRANTREACVISSAELYRRLMGRQSCKEVLQFATLSEISANVDGTVNNAKMKGLVQLFGPDKDRVLTLLDFTKIVDFVFRELQTLSTVLSNATAIERVYESILNCAFYTIIVFTTLAILDLDMLTFGLSLAIVAITLSIVMGSVCSTILEGILMILMLRPYGKYPHIGDRIALSKVDDDTNSLRSFGWIVEDISLLNTTVRNDKTREVATISNGSLARSRIINARRSDKAQLMIYLKFGVDETFARKILLFQAAVKKFVHDRPHEFYRTVRFRSTSAESDLGFAEHVIVLQCKASWQQFEEVMESKAKVDSFSLEVQTKLGISYSPPPPMPVNPSQVKGDGGPSAPFITENSGVRANRRDSDMTYSLKTEDSSKVWRGSSTSKVDVIQHALSHLFERKKIR